MPEAVGLVIIGAGFACALLLLVIAGLDLLRDVRSARARRERIAVAAFHRDQEGRLHG